MYSISYIAAHNSVPTLCTDTNEAVGYAEFPMTVLVEVATVSSISGNACPDIVSEEAVNSRFVIPKCTNEGEFDIIKIIFMWTILSNKRQLMNTVRCQIY